MEMAVKMIDNLSEFVYNYAEKQKQGHPVKMQVYKAIKAIFPFGK